MGIKYIWLQDIKNVSLKEERGWSPSSMKTGGLEKDLRCTGLAFHSHPAGGGLLCFNNFMVSEEKMEVKKVGFQVDI